MASEDTPPLRCHVLQGWPRPVLCTERLILRPREPTDADACFALVSEWEVVRWTASWPWPPDRAFNDARANAPPPEDGALVAILRDGPLIGMASVVSQVMGYMLAPSAWGQGYATEACAALLDVAFSSTDWSGIEASVFVGNDASMRVLRKLGFQEVRREPGMCRAQGCELDGIDFALTREAWAARPSA